jgi:hypothetical protein
MIYLWRVINQLLLHRITKFQRGIYYVALLPYISPRLDSLKLLVFFRLSALCYPGCQLLQVSSFAHMVNLLDTIREPFTIQVKLTHQYLDTGGIPDWIGGQAHCERVEEQCSLETYRWLVRPVAFHGSGCIFFVSMLNEIRLLCLKLVEKVPLLA